MTVERDSLMDLPILSVSSATFKGTPAQDWAYYINEIFTIFDAHTHNEGSGKKISSSNLIPDNLTLNNFSIAGVDYITFTDAFSVPNGSFYISGADEDLYYKDVNGTDIRFTQAGALATSSGLVGGFSGDYVADNAMAIFDGEKNIFNFFGSNGADNATIDCNVLQINETLNCFTGTFSAVINGTAPAYFSSLKLKVPATDGNTNIVNFYACDYQPVPDLPVNTPQIWKRDKTGSISAPKAEFDPTVVNISEFSGEKYWIQDKNSTFVNNLSKNYRLFYKSIRDPVKLKIPSNTSGTLYYPYVELIGGKLVFMKPVVFSGLYDNSVFLFNLQSVQIKISTTYSNGVIKIDYQPIPSNVDILLEIQILWMLPNEGDA